MENLGISVTNEQLLINPLVPSGGDLQTPSSFNITNTPTITLPLLAPPTFTESLLKVGGISHDSLFLGASNTSLLKSVGGSSDLFPTAPIPEGMGVVQRSSNVASLASPGAARTIDLPSTQLASSTATNPQPLTPEILAELKSAAIDRWASLGLSTAEVEKLQGTKLVVDDLASNTLAQTQGYTIILDWDASGIGWYVDSTPLDNTEFTQQVSATELVANGDSVAFRKVDLLSTLTHEFGHILGLEHSKTDALMRKSLPIGERLLPSLETLRGIRKDGGVSDRADLAGTDLIITNFTIDPQASWGQSTQISWTVTNQGDVTANSDWYDNVYLTDGTNYTNVGSYIIDAQTPLAPGVSYTKTVNIDIPYDPSKNKIVVFTDTGHPYYGSLNNLQAESNEDNNSQVIATINAPDLAISDFKFLDPIATWGETTQISWTVTNQGSVNANRDWYDNVYLTDGTNYTNLGSYLIDAQTPLSPGTSYTKTVNIAIPYDTSKSKLIVFTDTGHPYYGSLNNLQAESNEDNNSRTIDAPLQKPDLVISDFKFLDPIATWGETTQISWTVTNQGSVNANRDWYDNVYLTDGTNYTNLGSYLIDAQTPLSPGTSYTKTVNIAIPYDTSKNKIVVFTDTGHPYYGSLNNLQAESNEDNNSRTIDAPLQKPDLVISDFKFLDPIATWGETTQISWTVTNQGSVNANRDWYDNVYLTDGTNYTNLGSYLIDAQTPLSPGTSYTKTVNIDIPYDPSKNKIVVFTDTGHPYYGSLNNLQAESNEDNNSRTTTIGPQTNPSPVDLIITNLSLPTSTITWGQATPITWIVKNQGSYATTVNWTDYLYASDDDKFDINDIFIGIANKPNNIPLNSGESYTNTQSFNISGAATGRRYLLAVANRDNQQVETDETNNVYAIDAFGDPDLTITNATAPGNATAGEIVPISWTVTNTGTHDAIRTWFDAVYLSDDLTIGSTDTLITSVPQGASILKPGESYTSTRNITIPSSATGQQYLLFATNHSNSQRETNSNNNTKAVKLDGSKADLVVSKVIVPANATWGDTVPVSWTVTNQGEAVALTDWLDYVYVSSDNKLDTSDTLITYTSVNVQTPLAAGDSYTITQNITIPTWTAGKPYLLFVADRNNYQSESNKTNNTNSFVLNASDLAITDIIAPTTATWGATIPVTFQVTNQGGLATSGNWIDGIYLSNNSTFDNTAVLVGQVNSGSTSIAGGASYTQSANITLPSNFTGQPYLFVVSNSQKQLLEAGYDNNIKSISLNVQAPDLVVTNFNTPATITPGELVNLAWTVKNQGSYRTDTNWRDRVYLSTDGTVSNDDLLIADLGVTNILQVGDSYTLTTQATIPQFDPTKTWKLLIKADANSNQTEVEELNNLTVNNVAIIAPDLVVTATTSPTQTSVNGTFDLSWTVTNQGLGSALGSWSDAIYLSNDNIFDSGDTLLGTKVYAQQLIGNTSYTATQTVTLPSQIAGSKYLIIRTNSNGSQSETDTTNNYRISPIAIAAPDLTISQLTAPILAQLGDLITVTWQVNNNSLINAVTGWNDRIYISKDNILDGSDLLLDSGSKSNLIGGGNYTTSRDVNIPDLVPGNYYLIAATDRDLQQLETDETNNTTFAAIQLKYPPYTDLVVDTINSPTTGTSGEAIGLTWRVSNQGQLATNSNSWTDRVYVSTKNIFDNTAIALGTIDRHGKLNPGENYLQTATFALPNGISGNYYTFVTTDVNNQVGEYKFEDNNTTGSAQAVAVTRKPDPDLVVTNLTYASTGQPGQTITVNWTVNNTGLGIAQGNWTDRVYLTNSTGTIEIPLQIKAAPTNLLGLGGSYSNSATITLPTNLADGNYHIVVVTNSDNALFEGDGSGNNPYTSGQITSGHPDLAVTVDASPLTATSGTTIPIHWTVQNIGTANTLTNWQDRVYLANTPTLDNHARLVGTFDRTGSLAVNDSYQGLLNITLPIDLQGRQYLFIQTDAGQILTELGSTANNLTSIPIDITLAPYADLIVSDVTAPELVVRDPAEIEVSWKVSNQGTGAGITSNWIDRVILVGEGKEITVGEFAHTGSLTVGGNYTRTESISLPAALTGKYQVFVRSDATNLVFENGSESNNYVSGSQLLTVTPIPYADLTVTNLLANSIASSGQTLTASWTVNNQGIGATNNASVYEEVTLTSDAQGKVVVAKLGKFVQLGGLGTGENYQRNQDFSLPNGLSGTFYLVVNVSGVFELDKTDNNTLISAPIQINLSPAPDLVISQITAPTNLQAGDKVDVSWQVSNNGIVDANGEWTDTVYLQETNKINAPLIKLGSFVYNNSLQAGKSYTRTELLTIPSNVQGQYQIIVKANETGSLYEPQVSNNTSSSTAFGIVYPPRPDLQVANIIVPDIVNAGGTVSVKFEIKNQGTATTKVGQWTDKVYLSLDDKVSSDDILIGSFGNGLTLDPGQSYLTTTDNVIVPKLFRDTAHIIVITDTDYRVDEGVGEANNIQIKEINVNSVKPADLVTSDVVIPTQAFAGSTIEVRYRVTNKGIAETNAENWTDTIWLAKTKRRPLPLVIGPDGENLVTEDIKLIELNHTGSLKVGESYQGIAKVFIPKNLSGQYYITPWSDNYDIVLEDTLEINNNPDDPNSFDNNNYKAAPITILQTPILRSDLAVTSVTPALTGISGSTTPFNITWEVTNQGVISTQATSWSDTIYLSTTPNLEGKNWRLGEVTHDGRLGVGESYQGQFSTTLNPGVAGTYVIVVTKPADEDENLVNNRFSAATNVTSLPPADLVVSNVTTAASSFSGEKVNVSWTVTNNGDPVWVGTKLWRDEIWISPDPTFIPSRAILAGTYEHKNTTPLAAGASYSHSQEVTLPAGIDGKYYVYVTTDYTYQDDRDYQRDFRGGLVTFESTGDFTTRVFEDASNNLGGTNLQVTYREADLKVTNISTPSTLQADSQTAISWTVLNQGDRDTRVSNWTDTVYLSLDRTLDKQDLLLDIVGRAGILSAGQSYTGTANISLPQALKAGNYYLLVYTDVPLIEDSNITAVDEFRYETNNARVTPISVIAAPIADLQVTQVTTPERAIFGQQITGTYTVANLGNTITNSSSWNDSIYLSRDRVLDITTDRYVGSVGHSGSLAVNGSYTQNYQIDLPTDLIGPYYLFFKTDVGQKVYEGNSYTNNSTASIQPILLERPLPSDLQVDSILLPINNTSKSGESAQISWTVSNHSSNTAQGTWTDAVYLSSDNNWDIQDRLLGRITHTGDLIAGQAYTGNLTANIPSLNPGQYRIIVKTDVQNRVYEGDNEGNNQTISTTPLNLTVDLLQLEVALNTTLNTGQERLYRVHVNPGETLQVKLSGASIDATNELFVRYNLAPTSTQYDASYTGVLTAKPIAIIPNTEPGDYYILVRGQQEPTINSPVTLTTALLPFGITDIISDRGGDSKYVSAQILGAKFKPGAIVKLIRPGIAEVLPVRSQVLDSTKIAAIFDFTDVPHGLYDVKVINPDGSTSILPYRYLVERAIAPDVTVGISGQRVIKVGENANYGISVANIANINTPYVQFQFGTQAKGSINIILEQDGTSVTIPQLTFSSNLRGNPGGSLVDLPWAQLTSDFTNNGQILAPGYIFDLGNGGNIGKSFNLITYDGLKNLLQPRTDIVQALQAAGVTNPIILEYGALLEAQSIDVEKFLDDKGFDGSQIAFSVPVVVSATALTRDQFIQQQSQIALQLRASILADLTASDNLKLLAIDPSTWTNSYLAALEQAGLLRPEDEAPPIRTAPQVLSLLSTLSTGVLLGRAGQSIISTGDLVEFFTAIRTWYTSSLSPFPLPLSPLNTHTQSLEVYVPFKKSRPDLRGQTTVAATDFSTYFNGAGSSSELVTMTGPLGDGTTNFVGINTPGKYTVNYQQSGQNSAEIRIVTQLDPDLDLRTFQLGDLQLGGIQIHVPAGRYSFDGDFDFVQTKGYILRVNAGVEGTTGVATWTIQAIDPNTGEVIKIPGLGIPSGTVNYTILPKTTSATGTAVTAQARVIYSNGAPVDTQIVKSTIDAVAPTTTLTATQTGNDYLVKWTSVDDATGSGVKSTTVYVSIDGADYQVWQQDITTTEGTYIGTAGHSYEFLALSTDKSGNIEQQALLRDLSGNNSGGGVVVTGGGNNNPTPITTNPIFTEAQQHLLGSLNANNPSDFHEVIRPFVTSSFAKDIVQSEAGIGALALLPLADGTLLASGGANRGDLYAIDKLGNKRLINTLSVPIYDLAQDANDTIWATTGGGGLIQIDAQTGQIIKQYGDGITQSLAINPTTGLIYVSSGNGIEIFDPIKETFSHFSNSRVDSLAFSSDGSLWGTSWATRGDILKFNPGTGLATVKVSLDNPIDSLAFGVKGSKLENILFASSNDGNLFAVDLNTLKSTIIASGGSHGENIKTTADGRIYGSVPDLLFKE